MSHLGKHVLGRGKSMCQGLDEAAWEGGGTAEARVAGTEVRQSSCKRTDQRGNVGLDIGMMLSFT